MQPQKNKSDRSFVVSYGTKSIWVNQCVRQARGGGGGGTPLYRYIGMCGPKGYGFSAVLVINRVSILADFGHFGHK